MILRPQYYLSFDGVDDYVQAANSSVFEDLAFPQKIDFQPTAGQPYDLMGKAGINTNPDAYNINYVGTDFGFYNKIGTTVYDYRFSESIALQRQIYEVDVDGNGDLVQKIDGVEKARDASPNLTPNTNSELFTVGVASSGTQRFFQGRIYSFQVGTETFPLNEGTGTTITGSEGTVLDIYGATWGGGAYNGYIGNKKLSAIRWG